MPLDLFQKLIPFIHYTGLIHLQGWGEPLLNPDIYEMIRISKEKTKCVGLTTNGTLLNEDTIRRLLDNNVDIVGISLAGATASSHNSLRPGSDFDMILSNLRLLSRIKEKQNSRAPAIHLAYIMLKSNIHELEQIVQIAQSVGVAQIVASNLSLIVEPKLYGEALFNNTDTTDRYYELLEKTKEYACRNDIVFSYGRADLNRHSMWCSENVGRACVVNVDGEVSPCVFTNPILKTDRWFDNRLLPLKNASFGNIREETLSEIWHKKEYVKFRNFFNTAAPNISEKLLSSVPEPCIHCYKRLLG